MKTKLLLLPLLLITGMVWGQVKVDIQSKPKKITIETDKKIDSIEVIIPRGKYDLEVIGGNSLIMKKGAKLYSPLSVGSIQGVTGGKTNSKSSTKIKFGSNTEYVFLVTADEDPKSRKYVLKSQSNWEWTTTLGANAVVFTNRSKFISTEKGQVHTVAEIQDRKSIELMPAIMFTFMNKQENFSFGYTGGIGFNFEELALFTGLSLGIGQNIVLTGGVAVHKQNRPNSDYYIGQVIENTITTDDLNQKQYRFNPFLGLSFRLDSNPFKSK